MDWAQPAWLHYQTQLSCLSKSQEGATEAVRH